MLKKVLFISILLVSITSISWLGTTAYISHQTQSQFDKTTAQTTLKNLHVIDYKKGFNHSQIRFKLTTQTGNTTLNQILHTTIFNAHIKHGPILYTNNNLHLAHSYWQVDAEHHSLPANTQQLIKKLVADQPIFKLNILFNFNQQGHYQLDIPSIALSEFEQRIGTIAPSHLSGRIDLAQQRINLEGKMGEINIKNNNGHLHIPATEVYADNNDSAELSIKRKVNLRTEKVTYKSDQLANDIYFHLNLHIQQQINTQQRNNIFSLNIHDAKTPEQMIKAVNVKLDYKEHIRPTTQTLPWLNHKSMIHAVLQQLEQNQGALTFSFNVIGQQGQIDLQAQADTHSNEQANQLKAFVSLNADKKYIDSTPLTNLLKPYIDRNVLVVNKQKYQFHAAIDGDKATLNGLEILENIMPKQQTSSIQKAGF